MVIFVQEKLERLEEGILGDLGRQVIASTKMIILFFFGEVLANKSVQINLSSGQLLD